MALITRVSRLFAADLNAVIDQIEAPDVVLKQSLREMREALAESKEQLKSLTAQSQKIEDYMAQARRREQQLREELDVCLDADSDELARSVVRRLLEAEATLATLEETHVDLKAECRQQTQLIEAQAEDLTSLEQKAELADLDRHPIDPATTHSSITSDQVEVALLREKQARAKRGGSQL